MAEFSKFFKKLATKNSAKKDLLWKKGLYQLLNIPIIQHCAKIRKK